MSDYDTIALEAASAIEAILTADHPGGAVQRKAKVQVAIIEAIDAATGSLRRTRDDLFIANNDYLQRARDANASLKIEREINRAISQAVKIATVDNCEHIERLKMAIEGECEGLAIDDNQARAILDYLEHGDDDVIGYCEGCGRPIRIDDLYLSGTGVYLCQPCAPSYSDMLNSPSSFRSFESDKPLTGAEANAAVAEHMAAGGRLEDKIV